MINGLLSRFGVEVRQAGYTDALTDAMLSRAAGQAITATAIGGVQFAAGLVARSLSTADVDGDMGVLTPGVLADVGYDLVRQGEYVALLRVDPSGRPTLVRAATTEPVVYGSSDPASWKYVLTLAGPSNTETIAAGAEQVLHLRQNTDALQPWRGRSPVSVAAATGLLAANLSQSLGHEASILVGRIIAMPSAMPQGATDSLRSRLANPTTGRVALPETTARGFGRSTASSPQSDWIPRRIGFDAPTSAVDLHALLLQEIASICGVPAPLAPGAAAAGPTLREAQREFLTTTVQPIGGLLEAEAARVLEKPVRIRHHRLAAADVAARARGVHVLTEAGIARELALRLVGWDVDAA